MGDEDKHGYHSQAPLAHLGKAEGRAKGRPEAKGNLVPFPGIFENVSDSVVQEIAGGVERLVHICLKSAR